MMLGKRARHPIPMKRTTSMTEFSFDDLSILHADDEQVQVSSDPDHHHQNQMLMGLVSPRLILHRRNSADFALAQPSPSFLRACTLCRRRLAPGRDIFMYRGDSAYCSSECRQQQMAQDEWKEKCSTVASSSTKHSNSSSSTAGSSVASANAETVAAL